VAQRRSGPRPRWGRIGVALAILLAFVVLLTALAVRVVHSGEILPGVRVAGVPLSGLSEDEAQQRLTPALRPRGAVALVAEGLTLKVDPERAGYFADVEASVERALESGRGGPLGGFWSTVAGLLRSRDVPFTVAVDDPLLHRAVASAAKRIESRAFAGALVVNPGSLTVSTRPPRAGREVDRDELATRLRDELRRRGDGPVDVPLGPTAVVERRKVADIGRAAERYLRAALRLTGAGRPFTVSRAELASLLAVRSLRGGRDAQLGADDERLAALVARVAGARSRSAREPRFSASPRAVTLDAKGSASWRPRRASVRVVAAGRTGRAVRRDALAAAIQRAIRAGRHSVAVPTQTLRPAVTARAARRVRSLIATFTTYYAPAPRVTNIQLIARAVDGTVVAPGGRFSLNQTAGPRTSADGYVEAPFIADGRLVPTIGGGVSQFSTTIYNAAYFAGLRLDSHRPHSFFIDRYPAGRESTLNYPDIDLAWTNDTDAPVLVRTVADGSAVTVSLYGDNGGRRVRAQAGIREPTPDGAFKIVVTRIVRYRDGRIARQPVTTSYDKPPPPE